MWATDRIRFAIGACLFSVGCAANPAPRGWLAPADSAQRDPYGAWIEVTHVRSPATEPSQTAGELIAVNGDTVFVLPLTGDLTPIPMHQIRGARLASYASRWGLLAGWTAGGTVSTMTHGFLLLLSAPTWILVGSIASSVQSHAPIERIRRGDRAGWLGARKYARFPQGMPDDLDRGLLRPKHRRE